MWAASRSPRRTEMATTRRRRCEKKFTPSPFTPKRFPSALPPPMRLHYFTILHLETQGFEERVWHPAPARAPQSLLLGIFYVIESEVARCER